MGFITNALVKLTVKNTVNSAKKWTKGKRGTDASIALYGWVNTRKRANEIMMSLSSEQVSREREFLRLQIKLEEFRANNIGAESSTTDMMWLEAQLDLIEEDFYYDKASKSLSPKPSIIIRYTLLKEIRPDENTWSEAWSIINSSINSLVSDIE